MIRRSLTSNPESSAALHRGLFGENGLGSLIQSTRRRRNQSNNCTAGEPSVFKQQASLTPIESSPFDKVRNVTLNIHSCVMRKSNPTLRRSKKKTSLHPPTLDPSRQTASLIIVGTLGRRKTLKLVMHACSNSDSPCNEHTATV